MSKRKQNAASQGSYKARVRRDKREEVMDAKVQTVLDAMAVSASASMIAMMYVWRRKEKR